MNTSFYMINSVAKYDFILSLSLFDVYFGWYTLKEFSMKKDLQNRNIFIIT